jgi:hypothetical protein
MSSQLKSELITRLKPVGGFTGVGVHLENGEDRIFIVAENGEVLLAQVKELMPEADVPVETFVPVTIIQAK